EPDALLLPPVSPAVEPLGAVAVAPPAGLPTAALGLAVTVPTWTTPVEFVAVLPDSASAGAAVANMLHRVAVSAIRMCLTLSPLLCGPSVLLRASHATA